MKIMIEISGGCLMCVTTTEPCEIYVIDHDNLKDGDDEDTLVNALNGYGPDRITWEKDERMGDISPEFDRLKDDALAPYREV
jgi:hypothetical protein